MKNNLIYAEMVKSSTVLFNNRAMQTPLHIPSSNPAFAIFDSWLIM